MSLTSMTPPGVEQAFLQVILPMPVLLRHQQALQPVGQARDHALQAGKLLIEKAAQSRQLLGLAKIGGRDFLVEFGGENLVAPVVVMGEGAFMAMRPGTVFRFACFGQVLRRLHRLVAFDLFAFVGLGCRLGGGAFAVLPGFLVFAILILAFLIFALGLVIFEIGRAHV